MEPNDESERYEMNAMKIIVSYATTNTPVYSENIVNSANIVTSDTHSNCNTRRSSETVNCQGLKEGMMILII